MLEVREGMPRYQRPSSCVVLCCVCSAVLCALADPSYSEWSLYCFTTCTRTQAKAAWHEREEEVAPGREAADDGVGCVTQEEEEEEEEEMHVSTKHGRWR